MCTQPWLCDSTAIGVLFLWKQSLLWGKAHLIRPMGKRAATMTRAVPAGDGENDAQCVAGESQTKGVVRPKGIREGRQKVEC